jgi:hypothetical protein
VLAADRIFVLGRALVPPPGYRADALIAMTYSLDLPMALALPLAMLREGELAGETIESVSRIELFEALRQLIPCYRVFCDAGGMYPPPGRRLRILPLLDRVIVPVLMPPLPSGHRPAFHPKLILVRFVREGAPTRMRAVCMSRNLTSDASLDVSVMLEGEETGSRSGEAGAERLAAALQQPLRWVRRAPDADHSQELIRSVADSVRKTKWRPPSEFQSCTFWPLGFGVDDGADPTLLRDDEERILVISPFLSASRLRRLTSRGAGHVLVSEQDALQRVGTRALAGFSGLHRLAPRIGGSQLHAKLYVAEARRRTRWLVGSANATEAAVSGNSELLVELVGSKPALRIDSLLDSTDGIGELLATYEIAPDDPAEPQADPRSEAEKEMRRLAALTFRGGAHLDPDGRYTLEISIDPDATLFAGLEVEAHLAGSSATTRIDFTSDPAGRLTGLELVELSPFLILSLELAGVRMERAVMLILDGVNCAQLGQQALHDAIRDPLAYLTYLVTGLDGGTELALTFEDDDPAESAAAAEGAQPSASRPQPALLEKLLQMLHGERPGDAGRFDEVGQLIEGFADQLPAELTQLWSSIDRGRRT